MLDRLALGVRRTALALAALALGCASPDPGTPEPAVPAPDPANPEELLDNKPSSSEPPETPSEPEARAVPSVCPLDMAFVAGRFCIDRWEATTQSQNGEAHSPYHAVGAEKVSAESRPGVVPQAYISAEEADLACKRSGKRLCTTAQWLDACMGTTRPKRTYPYGGHVEKDGACNTRQGGAHPLMVLHGGRRPTDSVRMNDPRINQLSSTVAPTAAFEACATPEGVHDLVGNLLEWTRGERPLLMGGYFLDAKENGDGCRYVTERHDAKYHDFSTGFRCCLEPDQAALVPDKTLATPAGYRSFENPAAPLPPKPKPPVYEAADAACPVDMALVDGNRCDVPDQVCKRWLVVHGQEPERACAEFVEPTACRSGTRHLRYCIDRYEYTPEGWSLPLVHVSWNEAELTCRAMDKRLCMEHEWEFACEGPEAAPYPYGYVRDGAGCNHDLENLFDPRQKLVDRRVAKDALPRCKSPFGVFNLVGNVDEWTTRPGNESPWRSILRGGWWLTGRNRCRAATGSHNEIYAGPQTGFRCCKAART